MTQNMSDAEFVAVFREIYLSASGHILAALIENYAYDEPKKAESLVRKLVEVVDAK